MFTYSCLPDLGSCCEHSEERKLGTALNQRVLLPGISGFWLFESLSLHSILCSVQDHRFSARIPSSSKSAAPVTNQSSWHSGIMWDLSYHSTLRSKGWWKNICWTHGMKQIMSMSTWEPTLNNAKQVRGPPKKGYYGVDMGQERSGMGVGKQR